jgi:hypothetical protein
MTLALFCRLVAIRKLDRFKCKFGPDLRVIQLSEFVVSGEEKRIDGGSKFDTAGAGNHILRMEWDRPDFFAIIGIQPGLAFQPADGFLRLAAERELDINAF